MVKNNCTLGLKGMPLKQAFVYDTSSQWFTVFETQIFFDTSW